MKRGGIMQKKILKIVAGGKENEAKQAAAFEHVFIETAFTAQEIQDSIAAEKRLGIDKLPCAFLSDDAGSK